MGEYSYISSTHYPDITVEERRMLLRVCKEGTTFTKLKLDKGVCIENNGGEVIVSEYSEEFRLRISELAEEIRQKGLLDSYTENGSLVLRVIEGAGIDFERNSRSVRLRYRTPEAQRARSQMIELNIPLVISVAKRERDKGDGLFELMSEGVSGLMNAIDFYNPTKAGFSTYATYCIAGRIKRRKKGRAIKISNRMTRKSESIEEEAREKRVGFLELCGLKGMRKSNANSLLRANKARRVFSLSELVERGMQVPYYDGDLREYSDINIGEILDALSPIERYVIIEHYWGGKSFKNIGIELGKIKGRETELTRERARQIHNEALKNLRKAVSLQLAS